MARRNYCPVMPQVFPAQIEVSSYSMQIKRLFQWVVWWYFSDTMDNYKIACVKLLHTEIGKRFIFDEVNQKTRAFSETVYYIILSLSCICLQCFDTWTCLWLSEEGCTVVVCEAAFCMEVRPGLLGKKMWWHFSEQRWEWSGGCVALS